MMGSKGRRGRREGVGQVKWGQQGQAVHQRVERLGAAASAGGGAAFVSSACTSERDAVCYCGSCKYVAALPSPKRLRDCEEACLLRPSTQVLNSAAIYMRGYRHRTSPVPRPWRCTSTPPS